MLSERHPEIAGYYLPRVTDTVVPNARRLLEAFRAADRRVVFTRHGPLLADGSDMVARRRRRDRESLASTGTPALWHRGTFEHEVVAALAPAAGELVIDKNTSSAFSSTGIEWLLRNMDVETLVLVGMATDMCVETTARDAADRGFNVILVEDATATFFEHHHRAALSGFARVFGQVWDTERVLAPSSYAAQLLEGGCGDLHRLLEATGRERRLLLLIEPGAVRLLGRQVPHRPVRRAEHQQRRPCEAPPQLDLEDGVGLVRDGDQQRARRDARSRAASCRWDRLRAPG